MMEMSPTDYEHLKETLKQIALEKKHSKFASLVESQSSLNSLDSELNASSDRIVLDPKTHLFYPLAEWFHVKGVLQPKYEYDDAFVNLKQQAFQAAATAWNWPEDTPSFDENLQILHYKDHNWLAIYTFGQGELIINLYNLTDYEPELDAQLNQFELTSIESTIKQTIHKLRKFLQSGEVSNP